MVSEKVLGFEVKGAKIETEVDTYYQVEQEDLVPVYLKSESVTIEWLEEEHNEQLRAIKDAVDKDTFDFVKTIFNDIMVSAKQVKV